MSTRIRKPLYHRGRRHEVGLVTTAPDTHFEFYLHLFRRFSLNLWVWRKDA